jgi:hypothetical protein
MIDIEKLKGGITKDGAAAATAELNRMIALHENNAHALKERIKRYLYAHATKDHPEQMYRGNEGSIGCQYAAQVGAAALLTELREELSK